MTARQPQRPQSAKAKKSAATAKKPTATAKKSGTKRTRRQTRAFVPVIAGFVWMLLVLAAVSLSSLGTIVVMAPVAVVAAASAARAGAPKRPSRAKKSGSRPTVAVLAALAATVIVPLLALAGPVAAVAALALLGGGAVVQFVAHNLGSAPMWHTARRVVVVFGPMVALTSVVIARHQGSGMALSLVAATLAYDVGAFIMGNGRSAVGGPVGVVFGVISVGVIAIFSAAALNPPFTVIHAGVVFAGVAVLAAAGVWVCQSAVAGERLPAARRFDSLVLSAPFWVIASALLLHR